MADKTSGRHRAPGRYNPLSELVDIVGSSAKPMAKSTAILAVSGGMVAAFSIPATASPTAGTADGTPASVSGPATSSIPSSVLVTLPAVTAPATDGPVAQETFGITVAAATAKPKPVVKRVVRTERTERSTQRTSRTTKRVAVAPRNLPPATSQVVAIAQKYLGIPYRYGGSSPSTGFDCSGFTQFVFRQVGISLPRTSEAQRQATTRVSNPQPGDLVFWGIPATHVGIYAGGGMMYDSPRSGKLSGYRAIFSGSVTFGRVG